MHIKLTIVSFLFVTCIQSQDNSYDTILINNKRAFEIKTVSIDRKLLLLTSTLNKQTRIIDTLNSDLLAYIEYPDFNKDGNADILVDYFGNNSTFFLYLFDPKSNTFIEIEGYSSFPNSVQLKTNLNYYYSYSRAGCADMNWVSDLFRIENFKIIHIGHIYGIGCDFEVNENPQVIEIYRVQNSSTKKMVAVKKLPYLKYIPEFGAKWDFIRKYWNANYKKF